MKSCYFKTFKKDINKKYNGINNLSAPCHNILEKLLVAGFKGLIAKKS
jgi:hypothetical protein